MPAPSKTYPSPVPGGRPAVPWVVRHAQQILLALAAAAGAFLLGAYVVSKLHQAELRGWEQVSFAMAQAAGGRRLEAIKTLDSTLAVHRSGSVAVQGHMLKSELLLSEGKKPEALAAAKEALRQAVSPEYKALAAVSLAFAQEENGEPSEALATYEKFQKDYPDHFLWARIQMQRGRLYSSLGKAAEARDCYEKLITLYPSTPWAKIAKGDLEDLNK